MSRVALSANAVCRRGVFRLRALVQIAAGMFYVSPRQTHLIENDLGPIREFRLLDGRKLVGDRSTLSEYRLTIEVPR